MNVVEERRARWQEICREFRESGMSRAAFCQTRGIAVSTLRYWLDPARGTLGRHQRSKKSRGDLVAVGAVSVGRQSVLRVRIGEQLVAELDLPCDEAVIRHVLRAAQSL